VPEQPAPPDKTGQSFFKKMKPHPAYSAGKIPGPSFDID
jgi:hypothetical protein